MAAGTDGPAVTTRRALLRTAYAGTQRRPLSWLNRPWRRRLGWGAPVSLPAPPGTAQGLPALSTTPSRRGRSSCAGAQDFGAPACWSPTFAGPLLRQSRWAADTASGHDLEARQVLLQRRYLRRCR